jgi:hypothetical protein
MCRFTLRLAEKLSNYLARDLSVDFPKSNFLSPQAVDPVPKTGFKILKVGQIVKKSDERRREIMTVSRESF